jgi:hypothetical protein
MAGGIGIGTWGANLPALARRASLSEGELGVVLLFFAAGAVLLMTVAPRIIARFGAGASAAVAAVLFGFGVMAVGAAQDVFVAATTAMFAGATFGALDVCMNNEAALQERQAGRPIMASFHAIFSLGTLVSALAYAGLARAGVSVVLCLAMAGSVVSATAALGLLGLRQREVAPAPVAAATPAQVRLAPPPGRVLLLGSLTFLAFFAEGAILDWIAVYVVRVVGEAESAGALAYAAFASAMTAGRFAGDRVKRRLGAGRLFHFGALLVALAFAAVLLVPTMPVVLGAMVLCGLGVANLVPILFSESGTLNHGDGGRAMSRVMTMGYAGILLGPALIGFLAEMTALERSLWTVVAALTFLALKRGAV